MKTEIEQAQTKVTKKHWLIEKAETLPLDRLSHRIDQMFIGAADQTEKDPLFCKLSNFRKLIRALREAQEIVERREQAAREAQRRAA